MAREKFGFLYLVSMVLILGEDARGQSVPIEHRIPKAKLIEEAKKNVPDTLPLDDFKAGDKLIYRDVTLKNIKVTGIAPELAFNESKLVFNCSPTVKGDLSLMYEHVVIEWQVRTIAKVFEREIKQSIPVEKREWRPRSNPFLLTAGLKGTIGFSILGNKTLNDKRIELDLQCTESRILNVDLNTGDGFRGLLNDVIRIGGAVPNDGPLNPLICKAMTRKIVIDPFVKESKESRERLSKIIVKELSIAVEEHDILLKGKAELNLP